jgi:hypothetical protein
MEWVFADPSLLDAITSDPPVPRHDGDVGGLAPSATPVVAEGVLKESAVGTESAAIEPLPMFVGESTNTPPLQPAEAAVVAPTPSVVGVVEGVIGRVGPSSPQPAAAVAEELPGLRQPATVPQEHDAPEGVTKVASPQERDASKGARRAASPKTQETGENSGAALPRDDGGSDAQVLEVAHTSWAAAFEVGDDTEDDKEVAACNTLERGLAWARRAFDELILPAMLVSFLARVTSFSDFSRFFQEVWLIFDLFGVDRRVVWSDESACDKRAPCRAGPVGDVTGRGSWGDDRSGGKRGVNVDDP